MRSAIFPGSFNPFHDGHAEVVQKGLDSGFDRIIIALGKNPNKKNNSYENHDKIIQKYSNLINEKKIDVCIYDQFLVNFIKEYENTRNIKINAVIKGLRNTLDFEYEKINNIVMKI